MSPTPSLFQDFLRRFVLRLVLMLGGRLAVRAAMLRVQIAFAPEGGRRYVRLAGELARLERLRAMLDDPELWEDPGFRARVAEAAARFDDPGRRAFARRRIYPNLFFALPAPLKAAGAPGHREAERSTTKT